MLDRLKETVVKSEIVDLKGYKYFVYPLTDGIPDIEPEILNEVSDYIIEKCDLDCDRILTVEAMGIPVATAVSMKTSLPLLVVRKRSYGLPGEIDIFQTTGYSSNHLYINGVKKGDRIVIVDDVLSTGGTMKSLIEALQKAGCTIVDAIVLFSKSDVSDSIEKATGVKVKSVLDVRIEGDKVVLPS